MPYGAELYMSPRISVRILPISNIYRILYSVYIYVCLLIYRRRELSLHVTRLAWQNPGLRFQFRGTMLYSDGDGQLVRAATWESQRPDSPPASSMRSLACHLEWGCDRTSVHMHHVISVFLAHHGLAMMRHCTPPFYLCYFFHIHLYISHFSVYFVHTFIYFYILLFIAKYIYTLSWAN